jgi:plastocyanin
MSMPRGAVAACACAIVAGACLSDRVGAPINAGQLCTVPLSAFGSGRAAVVIRDFAFLPDTVRIVRGATVTWSNCEPDGREPHTVAAADAAWSSPLLPAGGTYERRFDDAGAFEYTCGPHPHMRAIVIVTD